MLVGIRSSAVEQGTAVPWVTGSIPVGSFFFPFLHTCLFDTLHHTLTLSLDTEVTDTYDNMICLTYLNGSMV